MDLQKLKSDVPWINIEGGPCGGKTTALAAVCEWCQNHGYTPIIVPESATHLINSGFQPGSLPFQRLVLENMLHDIKLRMNAIDELSITKAVLVFDSGLARGLAYVPEEEFIEALTAVGLSLVAARDIYDGVIFLDSAAVGAESYYTVDNNSARRETLEEARAVNERTREAWRGTQHLYPIENLPGQSFEQKITRAKQALARSLGEPEPLEKERKFLLNDFDPNMLADVSTPIDVRQTYLENMTGDAERVRARGQNDHYLFFHTIKKQISPGVTNEFDQLIGRDEYDRLLIREVSKKLPIVKTRRCVIADGRYLEFDSFRGHREGLHLLEIEVDDMTEDLSHITNQYDCTEVTGDPAYSNYALADPK